MLEDAHDIELLPLNTNIFYNKFKGMLTVSPRDFVMLGTYFVDDCNRHIMVALSIDHPDYPPSKKIVRGHTFIGGWILTPDPDSSLRFYAEYLNKADLGGKLPGFVVKMVSEGQASCVTKARQIIEKGVDMSKYI